MCRGGDAAERSGTITFSTSASVLTAGTSVNSSHVSSSSALWPGMSVTSVPTVSISSMSSFENVW